MKKHSTKLMAVLLAAVMLLPLTVQAVPAEGWTAEAEQVYQTVTELVVQQVSERKDYIAAATQAENAKRYMPCGPPARLSLTAFMTSTYRRWLTGWTSRSSGAKQPTSPVPSAR